MTGRRGPSVTAIGWRRSRWRGRRRRRRCSTPRARSTRSPIAASSSSARSSRLLPSSPWQVQVGRLRCLRGVDTLTAVGLCAEIGDFERFARAEQLMSYVGLVPCESHDRAAAPARVDHQDRLRARPPAARRGRLALPPPPPDRQDADRPPTRPARRSDRVAWSAPTAASPHLDHASSNAPSAARSSRSPPPANSPASAGRSPKSSEPDRTRRQPLSRRLGRWRPGNARGTRDAAMSNPPRKGLATPDARQRLPTTNHGPAASQPAYISLTARRAQPAGPPPTQPTTHTTTTNANARNQRPPLDKPLSISGA